MSYHSIFLSDLGAIHYKGYSTRNCIAGHLPSYYLAYKVCVVATLLFLHEIKCYNFHSLEFSRIYRHSLTDSFLLCFSCTDSGCNRIHKDR